LHQKTFTPDTLFYTTPFAADTFYSRQLLHLTPFTSSTVNAKHYLHETPFFLYMFKTVKGLGQTMKIEILPEFSTSDQREMTGQLPNSQAVAARG